MSKELYQPDLRNVREVSVEELNELIGEVENFVPTEENPADWDLGELIGFIEEELPGARYGFDFNPTVTVSRDKSGKLQKAPGQAWVRYQGIDWSVTHEFYSLALVIAFMKVCRDLPRQEEYNKENAEKGFPQMKEK